MIVTSAVVLLALAMMLVEHVRPGRVWPRVDMWWLRALAMSAAQAGVVFLAGATWDAWFSGHRLVSAAPLGTIGGALTGYAAITFVYYWWHRARHRNDVLWRWLHQLHHSPQRIEILTSFYKHPLELIANSILSSVIVYLIVGLDMRSAALAVTLTGIAELFYHWNVRTPYWLGFLIQRPESHLVHHQRGLHDFNYSDLPLWDILFGTFHNPRTFDACCGFAGDGEKRFGELLAGRSIA